MPSARLTAIHAEPCCTNVCAPLATIDLSGLDPADVELVRAFVDRLRRRQ
jgi:hypothetical protein